MEQIFARYYELKQQQKEIEDEVETLRKQILELYPGPYTVESGPYKCIISLQERKEFDDNLLYKALPDKEIWRLVSKADAGKINGLLKLNVINEEILQGTYVIKQIPTIKVQKT
jgi:hypothetical protein